MSQKWRWCILAALGLFALAWGIYRTTAGWWFNAELGRAYQDIAARRFGPARDRLARLSALRPGVAEIQYQLGLCEQAAGRPDRAWAAWSSIAPGSPFAAVAARDRDRLLRRLHDDGRFATLEQLLEAARSGKGPDAAAAGQTLARLLRFECRFDELRRLLREEWVRDPDPPRTLRELWLLDADPLPIEMVRGVLDRAAAQAPDDDRVWLGQANLATWSGQFEAADRLLLACLVRRPRDPAVWRARLDWARASGRIEIAQQALVNLPADRMELAEVLELRAWFARHRGDREAERLALELLIERVPGDAPTLERLAILAHEAGRASRAGELRLRKGQFDRSKELYRELLAIDAPAIDLPRVARLAESLGRWFEAWGWWSLAARQAPDDLEARAALERLSGYSDPRPKGSSLADVIAIPECAPSPTRPSSTLVRPDFSDDSELAGIRFVYDNGPTRIRHLPETMGGGVGLLDYDGDGWLDVYCVQGGPFPPSGEGGQPRETAGDRLLRNRGDGTFEDATGRAGLSVLPGGYGHGVAVGDYDNDGWPDLFVTRWRSYALYHNRGDGTFEDVTAAAGLGGDRDWPTSAAWADLDADGDLDLYVCHYLAWDAEHPPPCGGPSDTADRVYCDPRALEPLRDHLFRNDGGRFVDVTAEAGIVDPDGRGLGVVAADLDGDGWIDLYVANDTTANYLFRNLGGLRFEEVGIISGVAAGASGGFQAGMGVACGDLDGDGLPDLAVTNFYGESTTFYRNLGGGVFGDQTAAIGLAAASRSLLGFGIAVLDFNNDGQLDLATANGHVNDYRPTLPYAMPTQLMAGVGGGHLVDASTAGGPPWRVPRVGRGMAAGDLDNDGRLDLLVVAQGAPLAYFHNRTAASHFVTLSLEGVASNRDGVGARVTVTCDGRRQVAQRVGGGSYLSAPDPRLHFGLGGSDRVTSVEVAWPSGRVDHHRDLPADAGYRLCEGAPAPEVLPIGRAGQAGGYAAFSADSSKPVLIPGYQR
jgi:tetratricopeptide (TPR) repeat protein